MQQLSDRELPSCQVEMVDSLDIVFAASIPGADRLTAFMHKHALVQARNVCICRHAKLIYALQTTTARYRIVHKSSPPPLSLNISVCPHFSQEHRAISFSMPHLKRAQ